MYVKVCGLRSTEHLDAAIEAGASAIGLVLVDSPRRVTVTEAAALSTHAGSRVDRVAVFRELDAGAIALALAAGCSHVQAQGTVAAFRALPPSLGALPVVLDAVEAGAQLELLDALRVPILLDGAVPGSGRRASVDRAAAFARRGPMILAGGLDASSVARAIARVRPFGVDVSSGVERVRGRKDAELVHAFVRAAREAFSALAHHIEVPS